ncbi:MAG: polyprenyl synthetase family protein [Alphaproteobacteria bacterium]
MMHPNIPPFIAQHLPAFSDDEKLQGMAAIEPLLEKTTGDMQQVNQLIMQHMQSSVPMVPKLAAYILASGGKRLRPLLTLGACMAVEGNMGPAHLLAAAVEFIHTATLLHDDVVDDGKERRGQPAAPQVFGNKASVLVGDFLFSRAFELMVETGNLAVLKILSNAAARIAEGEVLQLSTAHDLGTDFPAYLQVIAYKTGALFEAACAAGVAIGQPALIDDFAAYGMQLGIAFQIQDDALDYEVKATKLGKKIGTDFYDGKITLPIILCDYFANTEEKQLLRRCLQEHEYHEGDLEKVLGMMQRYDIQRHCREIAGYYAVAAIHHIPATITAEWQEIFSQIARFALGREY